MTDIDTIQKYDINDCINIILKNGDINNNENTCFDMSNKLKFHQELARPYVRDIIVKNNI